VDRIEWRPGPLERQGEEGGKKYRGLEKSV